MNAMEMTESLARAAAQDAGNRSIWKGVIMQRKSEIISLVDSVIDRLSIPAYKRLPVCPNCGSILDAWECCPHTKPEDAAIGLKTCNPQHPEGCLCGACVDRRDETNRILVQGQLAPETGQAVNLAAFRR